MSFINAEMAIYTLLRNAGYNAVLEVPQTVTEQAVWIMKTGGQRVSVFDDTRLQLNVIDSNRTRGRDTAEEIYDMLLDAPHYIPNVGLIDHVRSEGSPVEVPFKDQLKNYLFTVAVESREI